MGKEQFVPKPFYLKSKCDLITEIMNLVAPKAVAKLEFLINNLHLNITVYLKHLEL
jgi:hypothetical protein